MYKRLVYTHVNGDMQWLTHRKQQENHVKYHARRSLSTVGGTHVCPPNRGEIDSQSSGQSTPHYCPPLIHLHSLPPLNGVRSHSRCGTESWTELELAFHLTV